MRDVPAGATNLPLHAPPPQCGRPTYSVRVLWISGGWGRVGQPTRPGSISRCLGLSPAPAPRLEQATRVAGLTMAPTRLLAPLQAQVQRSAEEDRRPHLLSVVETLARPLRSEQHPAGRGTTTKTSSRAGLALEGMGCRDTRTCNCSSRRRLSACAGGRGAGHAALAGRRDEDQDHDLHSTGTCPATASPAPRDQRSGSTAMPARVKGEPRTQRAGQSRRGERAGVRCEPEQKESSSKRRRAAPAGAKERPSGGRRATRARAKGKPRQQRRAKPARAKKEMSEDNAKPAGLCWWR